MSKLIPAQGLGLNRREALRRIAGALVAAGAAAEMNPLDAQHVHQAASEMKGSLAGYQRQALTEHEWETVTALAELIVPADSGGGSAVDAGAVEFIDLLCSGNDALKWIYTGGISWLDAEMRVRYGKMFTEAGETERKGMLDAIVAEEAEILSHPTASGEGAYARFKDYQAWNRSEMGAGVAFFDWVRKMSVDAYYTSPMGVKDLGYLGNGAMSEYSVPQESIDYAMARSPFASDDD